MIRPVFIILGMVAPASFAQQASVEVGKHANVNIDALSMLFSLCMVLLLIVGAAWLLKKFSLVNKSVSGLKVIASLPLGTKERLVVVEMGEEQLLFSISAQGVSLVKTLDKPLPIADMSSNELTQPFQQFFKKPNN